MKKVARRATAAALTTGALAVSLTVGATGASAISPVNCGPSDYLTVQLHSNVGYQTLCFANAGQISLPADGWLTQISTGNNQVQWHGDGQWQPAAPIGRNTVFTWPNHPGGVSADYLRIL